MTDFHLSKSTTAIPGNLLLVVLDGVGLYRGKAEGYPGNALDLARAPTLKGLLASAPLRTELRAHGVAVGLPSDADMGNSEVGHNALGAGRIFDQGAKLVSKAIESGRIFTGQTWQRLIGTKENPGHALQKNRPVHFLGLLSDGNVHSHIDHLLALIRACADAGVKQVYVHALLDGRDVEKQSADIYIKKLNDFLRTIDPSGENYCIASGGGRMQITMDRYEADWGMVERGWKTHVKGDAAFFSDALEAVEEARKKQPGIVDQDIPPFVIAKDGVPVGPIQDGDVVIFYNFRGDRAIEISRAFTEKNFTKFKRDPEVEVEYAGMMEYDGDLKIPPNYLVEPPAIDRTLSEYMVRNGISQFAISETQKFGHVTYFWNGNNSEKFSEELETWVEIPSDNVSFDERPRMKADEITDALVEALKSNKYKFLRANYANGDMVGHTGSLEAAIQAVEAVDENLGRLLQAAEETKTTLIITADHGNCDQMFEVEKDGSPKLSADGTPMPKTSHTLNPVPFLLTGPGTESFVLNPDCQNPGLANVAASVLRLLGYEPPKDYEPAIVTGR